MEMAVVSYEALAFIVQNMREKDRQEVFATAFPLPEDSQTTDDELFIRQTYDASTREGCGWVAFSEGEPIAAIGISMMWPGVASVWMFATESFPKIALPLTRWAKKTIIQIMNDAGLHRAQCWSLGSHGEAHRWLLHLGAEQEAVVEGYGRDGETFHLFGWVKGRNF